MQDSYITAITSIMYVGVRVRVLVCVCVFKFMYIEHYIPKIFNKIYRYNAYANVNIRLYTYVSMCVN